MERPVAWQKYGDDEYADLERVCMEYRGFLSDGKTERACVRLSRRMAEEAGYRDLKDILNKKETLHPGDRIYSVGMKKTIALFQLGRRPLEEGMNILCAHIDSPRLDVKQNPLYEDSGLAYFDTHYYGGVKKYQWVAIPLAIHGVVAKKDGSVIDICIGEDENDPVVTITDLLIHLAGNQLKKSASEVVEGENLDVLIGSRPLQGLADQDKKEAVQKNLLRILKDTYGFEEEDLLSAELEVVPAGKARDCGLDRSMIISYGQDDRVCAFTSLLALLEESPCEKTSCCLLVDKEEIGSVGATGMQSRFFENTVADLLEAAGEWSDRAFRQAMKNSRMLSSDVAAGFDPAYADVFEKKNAAFLGKGVVFCKFTGARGKSGSNDANAEYLALIRRIMDDNQVSFQTAELGKVDVGGGGTIAYIAALYGMEVIDSGVAVLCMHAPWEVTSKADIYEAYKAYRAFLRDA